MNPHVSGCTPLFVCLLHFELPPEYKKTLVQTLAIPRNARVASPYFCAEEATTCEALNLKDGVSALQVCSAPSLESATTRRH